MGFDPCNLSLNIWESIGTPTPKVGVPLGVWGFIPSHFLALPGACGMTPGLPSWPATLQPFALVASPRLGLQHGCWPKSHKCFTIVEHFKGWALRQILHGQRYLSCLLTCTWISSHSQSLMFQPFIHLASPNGNHLFLWSSIFNYVPCIHYFCTMPP